RDIDHRDVRAALAAHSSGATCEQNERKIRLYLENIIASADAAFKTEPPGNHLLLVQQRRRRKLHSLARRRRNINRERRFWSKVRRPVVAAGTVLFFLGIAAS